MRRKIDDMKQKNGSLIKDSPVKKPQIKAWQILGLSIAAALIVICVIVTHSLIKGAIAARTSSASCWRPPTDPRTQTAQTQTAPTQTAPTQPNLTQPNPTQAAQICYTEPILLNQDATTAIAVTPDGKTLLNSVGSTIQLWDLSSKTLRRKFLGHRDWVSALAIHPQGEILASSSLDGTIKLWNIRTRELLATLPAGRMTSLAFSPDGSTLASATRLMGSWNAPSPSIQFWDIATHQQINQISAGMVNAIAFSPNGQYLAAGAQTTSVWDVSTGNKRYTVNSGDLNALLFSRDGEWLLTGSDGVRGEDGIQFWDVRSGRRLRVVDTVATDFALSRDGRSFATTYGGVVNVWRMKPFGFLGTLRGSMFSGLFVEFAAEDKVVTGSSDGIRLWELAP
jgi:WD40 repeat protein